jgi:hypothetical protein
VQGPEEIALLCCHSIPHVAFYRTENSICMSCQSKIRAGQRAMSNESKHLPMDTSRATKIMRSTPDRLDRT